MRRSQAILRLPVDNVLATLILHDGERSDVLLFIPPGERVEQLVSPGDPFVPMIKNARFCLVARPAIAALGVPAGEEPADDSALPLEHQRARVRLRSGQALEGELRWTGPEGRKRTADYANDPAAFLVVHAGEPRMTYYVAKAEVALIEELP
ncbi:MAG TPA: hypothetical protein VFK02_11965 [Kofleriaceae bacterium]|nr:hypothetical protein [Kofleriaceae bacterium]